MSMGMFTILEIAGSGLNAQSVRLNTTASNMANADSVSSSVETTYRARHPVFQAVLREQTERPGGAAGGVRVAGIVESDAPAQREYRPGHPAADAEGYIFRPNISMVEEMANMMSASRSYAMNVELVNAGKQLYQRTLSLGQ